MYLEDLSNMYPDHPILRGRNIVAIGWLDKEHEFKKGLDKVIKEQLLTILKSANIRIHTKGFHICDFCGNSSSS